MKRLIWILALSCTVLGACVQQGGSEETAAAMKVNVVQAGALEFVQNLRLSGSWVAKDEIQIGTALQGQQIVSVLADVGAQVKKGQVLAMLEHSNAQSLVRQNQALLARAQANLLAQQAAQLEADKLLQRYRGLIASGAVSHQEWDQQQAKADAARAAVASARAEIAQIQAQLADSRHQRQKAQITAPADGVITKRTAEAGALAGGNALFHMSKNGVHELEVNVNADELTRLQTGLDARLSGSGAHGEVRLVFPEIDTKTRMGRARIAFGPGVQQPIGAFGEVEIALPTHNVALAVPFSALAFGADGKTSVMIVNGEGKVERRSVTLGTQNQSRVEVLSGLNAQDQVVQKAVAFVDVGDVVTPQLVKDKE